MNQAILLLSNKSSEFVVSNFKKISESVQNYDDTVFVYHQNDNYIPDNIKSLNHYVFTNNIFDELDYIPLEKYSLLPGCDHFPLFKFYLEHPNYDYYWHIEDDVRFQGDWKYLFDSFSDCNADFIACNIQTNHENPDWYWWFSLKYQGETVSNEIKVRSFNAVRRISNRALAFLHKSMLEGWSGHHEVLMATLLHNNGFKMSDFGGEGSFVPKGQENRFYTVESMSHLPIEMGFVENRIYHPIKEKKEIDLDKLKKYCVISAVGKSSLHREWIKENSDFDLHLIVYDDSYNKFYNDTDFISYQRGYKFKLVYDYLIKNPVYLEKYEYFFVPDDDIRMDAANIYKLFCVMQEQELEIAQPALSDSYYSYEHIMKQKGVLMRYTNFVEMMIPCFSRNALKKTLFTFDENISGWGIDFHWSKLIGFTGKEMAVIDDLHCVHTRPVQSCSERNVNELDHYTQKYNLLREIKEYGQINITNIKKTEDWIPLVVSSHLQIRIKEKLDVISRVLLSSLNETESVGLAEGRIGISLFFFNYYRLTGKRKFYDIALSIFESIYNSIGDISSDISLSDGLAGVSWAVEYLAQNGFIDDETDEILGEICEVIDENNPLDTLAANLKVSDNDDTKSITENPGIIVTKMIEYGIHYVARVRNPKHSPAQNANHLKEKYIVFQIINYLDFTKPEYYYEKYNVENGNDNQLVLNKYKSHCAIIYFLSTLQELNIGHTKLQPLLSEYIDHLYKVFNKKEIDVISKLLFANALNFAGKVTDNSVWTQKALIAAQETLHTKPAVSFDLQKKDSSLYIAHLYNRIYQVTLLDEFRVAAEKGIEQTLIQGNEDVKEFLENKKTGFYNGLAGVGINLITAIADFEPCRDELLFFNLSDSVLK